MNTNRHLPLQQILLRYWIVAVGIAVLLTLASITAISYTEYSIKLQSIRESFSEKSEKGFRRLEADLAVNNHAAMELIIEDLHKRYDIDFEVLDPSILPQECASKPSCLVEYNGQLKAYKTINTQNASYLLSAKTEKPIFLQSLSLSVLSWLGLAIVALAGIGIVFQRFAIKKYIIQPIHNLAGHTIKLEDIPSHYPKEIAQLAAELEESIKGRDKVVFGQLASGVIHDLRTQIYSIETAQKLLSEVSKDNPSYPKRIELLLQAAERNIPKMKAIIETTLDGAREITLQKTDLNLRKTITSAIEANQGLANARKVNVELDAPEAIQARHDSVQLERVFSNLIKNAIEAFDNDETNPIRTVKLNASEDTNSVEINIEDSGPGINLSSKEVFHISKTTKPHGSGLGLLISKKIITAHDGEISHGRSSELNGAKILIKLPKNMEAQT